MQHRPAQPGSALSADRASTGLAQCLVAAGLLALAATPAAAGCNSGIDADTDLLSSLPCQASAPAVAATAVGAISSALGDSTTALGAGAGPRTAVEGATALGARAGIMGAGPYSIAIGAGSIFSAPTAQGGDSIAIGGSDDDTLPGAVATGLRSIAIGQKSNAGAGSGFGTAVGFNTTAVFAATSIGTDSSATGDSSTAIGRFSNAAGANAAALGASSQATAGNSTAIGSGARAIRQDAVAIGSNSVANAPDTVSVGHRRAERRITNVAAGINPTDAVNFAQVQRLLAASARVPAAPATASPAIVMTAAPRSTRERSGVDQHGTGATAAPGIMASVSEDRAAANASTVRSNDLAPSTVVGWANVRPDGALFSSRNIAGDVRRGVGAYKIDFKKPSLRQCTYNATLAEFGFVSVKAGPTANSILVETRNHYGVLTDLAFYIMAVC
jgi:hypothetical protein